MASSLKVGLLTAYIFVTSLANVRELAADPLRVAALAGFNTSNPSTAKIDDAFPFHAEDAATKIDGGLLFGFAEAEMDIYGSGRVSVSQKDWHGTGYTIQGQTPIQNTNSLITFAAAYFYLAEPATFIAVSTNKGHANPNGDLHPGSDGRLGVHMILPSGGLLFGQGPPRESNPISRAWGGTLQPGDYVVSLNLANFFRGTAHEQIAEVQWWISTPPGGSPSAPSPYGGVMIASDGTTPVGFAAGLVELNGGDIAQNSNGNIEIHSANGDIAENVVGIFTTPVITDSALGLDLGLNKPVYVGNAMNTVAANNVPALLLSALNSWSVASSYQYRAYGLNFASVVLPDSVLGYDEFDIRFGDSPAAILGSGRIRAGVPFDFTAFLSGGVRFFELLGFERFGLSANEAAPFALGFTFVQSGEVAIVQSVIAEESAVVPEPSSLLLLALGAGGLCSVQLRRRLARKQPP